LALERLRGRWERTTGPLLDHLGWLRPNHLTWASLIAALAAAWFGVAAGREAAGPWLLVAGLMGLAFLFDGLDGQLARRRGLEGPAGDLLDHTLDRVVDAALLVALGSNPAWFLHPDLGVVLGWAAALATMFGSYMGTAAQSVGLERDYGGFGRADRSVVLLLGVILAAAQSEVGWTDLEGPVLFGRALQWNGVSGALTIALLGGVLSFVTRFSSSLKELSQSDSPPREK